MKEHDVVVLGAGHNGLIAACYLAKAGLDVAVVEQRDHVGGDCTTEELTLPGFKHDRGSIMHCIIQGNPLLMNDELKLKSKYGLDYIFPEANLATTFPDGTAIIQYVDLDKTVESIAKISPHDAEQYRKFIAEISAASNFISAGSFSAPVDFDAMVAQFQLSEMGRNCLDAMNHSAYDLLTRWFEHPKVITHLTKFICEMFLSPYEVGTGFYLYMLIPASHAAPWALPRGGSQELPNALKRCLEDNGGTVYLNSEVRRIPVQNGRATGVVLADGEEIKARRTVVSSLDARLVFGEGRFLDDGAVDATTCDHVQNLRNPSGCGAMMHFAMNDKPAWIAGEELDKVFNIEPCPMWDDYKSGFEDIHNGMVPHQVMPMCVTATLFDPTRAPDGMHTFYVGPEGPWDLANGGAAAWDEYKFQYAEQTIDQLGQYISNLKDITLKWFIDSPLDMERWNPCNYKGTVLGPGMYTDQMFANRPAPKLGRYKTPVDGLWICGASTHPAGGVNGGSRAMVPELCEELGIDFEDLID